MEAMKAQFLGKEVQVYPGDTHAKYATVIDINPVGVTFKAASLASRGAWKENSIHFIAFSANLKFVLI